MSKKLIDTLNFDIVYITNPIYKHIETKKGSNIFLEKPVSHNLNKADLLKYTALKKNYLFVLAIN